MKTTAAKILSPVLMIFSMTSFALSTDLINQCTAVISMPEAQFNSQAAALNSLLDNCTLNNVCSQINSIDNCAGILEARDFYSNYLALAPADSGPSFGSFGPTAPNMTFSQPSVDSKYNNNPVSISPPTRNNNNNNNNKEIHWF